MAVRGRNSSRSSPTPTTSPASRSRRTAGEQPPHPPGSPQPDPAGEHPFPTIPGYEILAHVERGGQGDVYQARHLKLNRIVALKVLHRGRPEEAKQRLGRFHREGRLSA